MPLHLYLKPNETLLIGEAVVVNGERSSEITILNNTPVLRQKHFLPEDAVKTTAQRLQYAVQQLVMSETPGPEHFSAYDARRVDALLAYPGHQNELQTIDQYISTGKFYQALQFSIAFSAITASLEPSA